MSNRVQSRQWKLIAEYSNQTPKNSNTSYVATDTLPSLRMVTDKSGNVVSRRDFQPFGEELPGDGSVRTTADNYSTSTEDKIRQRFSRVIRKISNQGLKTVAIYGRDDLKTVGK